MEWVELTPHSRSSKLYVWAICVTFRCLYCDAAFDYFNKLSTHSREGHHHYFCDICFAGFISAPLLVEHHVNDHPKGCPDELEERAPIAPKEELSEEPEVVITKVIDPELEKAMKVIRIPEPDPFADKWHPALGQTKKDGKNKVECEVCHRYLKTVKFRVDYVQHFHPLVSYDCKFCPELVFYATQDLIQHCQKTHFICDYCDSAHKTKEILQAHIKKDHENPAPEPAPKPVATSSPVGANTPEEEAEVPSADDVAKGATDPDTSAASEANICPAHPGFTCSICKMYSPTPASFRIHLSVHRKTPCPFCPEKFFNPASRNLHIRKKHKDRRDRQLSVG